MTIGVDVSKDTLVPCPRNGHPSSVANSVQQVKRFLSKLDPGTTIGMEATGRYHRLLADTAYAMGFVVFVFNPKDVNRYAKSVSPRAATDPIAARIIAEFASVRDHRPYVPPPTFVDVLRNLVRTRAGLVKQRVGLENQAGEHTAIAVCLAQVITSINQSVAKLEKQIVEVAKARPEYRLLTQIPGFGPLVSAYMLAPLGRGDFRSSDAFVAFIGLDLRVRESGKLRGRRKLSKRGDPEARRLLYLARGYSKTEAAVFIARKLARVAWAICTKQQPYNQQRVLNQHCHAGPTNQTTVTYAASDPVDKHIANVVLTADRQSKTSITTRRRKTPCPSHSENT